MAAPADIQSPAEIERTQPSNGPIDRTLVGRPTTRFSPCGFGPPLAAGEVGALGPYRIVRQLGKGGMGAVYAAVDTRLDRRLALKVMLPEAAADADAKERFLREARAAAQISHDNVVTVFEADERDGVPYIAMQFLEGSPLDAYLKKKGAPSIPQTMRIAREAAAGLAAAHALDLVHRDIKPGNLWLEAPNGRVKVLDFGLAKAAHAEVELTQSGMVVGTPAYMSPEQARGLKVDGRSDLFSLGAVLYRLCTDRLPFDGPTTMAVLLALGTDDPTPVRELNPAVPEPLAALIHQLLAKDPDERPQSAAEVVRRLQSITNGTGASNVVVTPSPRVVYVPVQVTGLAGAPPFANPFADLDATAAEPAPGDEGADAAAPEKHPARKTARAKWHPAALSLAALFAIAASVAVIVGLNRGGTKATGAPDGSAGAVKGGDAKPPAPVGPKAPNGTDPDRAAAEAALAAGGVVMVAGQEREFRAASDLPKDRFALAWVNLTDRPVTDADLARFKDCKGLTSVTLHGTKATDAAVPHFKNSPGLTYFSAAHTGVTDAALAHLKEFKQLTHLWVQNTKVTDAGLVNVKELKQLELLFIGATAITDAGVAHLKDLTELKILDLDETKVTDAGIVLLRDHRNLSYLSVRRTGVTAKGLTDFCAAFPRCRIDHDGGTIIPAENDRFAAEWVLALGGMVRVNGQRADIKASDGLPKERFNLTWVNLSDRPVRNDDLVRLAGCRSLTGLVLHGTKVTDAALAHLKGLPDLQFLSFTGARLTDAGLEQLKRHARLHTLHITGTDVTDAGLVHLKELPELTELFVSDTSVSDAGLAHLKELKKLRELELNETRVTDAGLAHLKELTDLRVLCLERAAVTGTGLAHFRDLTKLEHLALTGSPVTDAGVAHLSGLHSIQRLYLNGTKLTDAGVPHARKIGGLFVANLSDTAVTDAGLMALGDHAGVQSLTVNNTRVTKRGVLAFHALNPGRVVNWSGGEVAATDPDRAAARWVLAAGGKVQVNGKPSDITDPDGLPKDRFALTAALLGEHVTADYELVALKNAKQLTNVGLRGSPVTDAGLVHLKDLPNLRKLRLDGTKVTDAGLNVLKGVPLTQLDVRTAGVTQQGADAFRAAVPGCKVEFGDPEPKK